MKKKLLILSVITAILFYSTACNNNVTHENTTPTKSTFSTQNNITTSEAVTETATITESEATASTTSVATTAPHTEVKISSPTERETEPAWIETGYTYNEKTQTLTITGKGKMKEYFPEALPWYNIENPKHIVIEDGITSVADYAFQFYTNGALAEHNYYDKLETVHLPEGIKTIGWGAFYDCINLKTINLPDSVEKIGPNAFVGCEKLRKITISDNVKEIGKDAFTHSGLNEIDLPENGIKIHSGAFSSTKIKEIVFPGKTSTIKSETFRFCDKLEKITIKAGVKAIEKDAFYGCKNLSKVEIPETVTSIGKKAFYRCKSLKTVTIPKSVKTIGENAFGMYEEPGEWYAKPLKNFTIKGYKGSTAEKYAKENRLKFIAID